MSSSRLAHPSATEGIVSSLGRAVSEGGGPAWGIGFALPSAMVERIASGLIAARGR